MFYYMGMINWMRFVIILGLTTVDSTSYKTIFLVPAESMRCLEGITDELPGKNSGHN